MHEFLDTQGQLHNVPTEVIVDHRTLSCESSASRFRIGVMMFLFLARSEGDSGSIAASTMSAMSPVTLKQRR